MKKTLGLHAGIWILVVIIIISTIVYFTKQNNNIQTVPVVSTVGLPAMMAPSNYKIDTNYIYQALGPGKDIVGTKFTIPDSMATGTNLSNDTYISLEQLPLQATENVNSAGSQKCSASLFLYDGIKPVTVVDNNVTYSFASSSGAGAGNRYDEFVFAIPNTNPCIAVRYYIHYGAFENYPDGTVTKFNESSLIQSFDDIRRTLTLNK